MVRISEEKLVRELMKNSRTPFTKLGKKFKVTEAAVRKRVKKLENEGVIESYTIQVNPRKLGYNIRALIGLDTTPEDYVHVITKLKRDNDIISLYSSSGDHMLMMEVWLKDSNELTRFVKRIEGIKGVTRVCPAVMLERIK